MQQPNKHHKVFLDALDQVTLQFQSIPNELCVDINTS